MEMNEKQQNLLDRASKLLRTSEEEIMDGSDCGAENCDDCDSRHAIARLVVENPDHLSRILDEAEVKFNDFDTRMEALEKERDVIWAKKEILDNELESMFKELSATLCTPAVLLN